MSKTLNNICVHFKNVYLRYFLLNIGINYLEISEQQILHAVVQLYAQVMFVVCIYLYRMSTV